MKFNVSEMATEQLYSLMMALGWKVKEDNIDGDEHTICLFPPKGQGIIFKRRDDISPREDFADALQTYFDKTLEEEQSNETLTAFLRYMAED